MKILVNGNWREVAAHTLQDVLQELGYANATIATAVNSNFVPHTARAQSSLHEGDRLEIVTPMQGG
jgi:sulfur carrier protein